MIVTISSAKITGIDAVPVNVEVNISLGIGLHLVGLADAAVKESMLRTVTALQSIGFRVPGKKIVINLAPADMHKRGSGYDLPIAIGIISASEQIELPAVNDYLMMGELGLDASLRPVTGALSAAQMAKSLGKKGCIFPALSALEAVDMEGIEVYGVDNLPQVLSILAREEWTEDLLVQNRKDWERDVQEEADYPDFSEIYGQEGAKRGLEIAAAGGHNVIMVGAPGSGKTSLAKALAGILPPMSREEAMIATKIYSAAGKRASSRGLIRHRPFRAPHYSASLPAMLGGGNGDNILPGEVSLANGGVLFLDELTQMPKSIMESLRTPIEDRKVAISRLHSKVEYPASFILVAASNPCPCGYYGEKDRCTCTVGQRMAYLGRLSGPIMDRIDIQLWMHPVDTDKLLAGHRMGQVAESSAVVAKRVAAARAVQRERFGKEMTNAAMDSRMLQQYCPLSPACEQVLERVINKMGLSARAFSRIIKLSRTIADLEGVPNIEARHLLEAVSFRFLDKRDIF